jgi:NNP family nitrate/nitrite transporter-like MFS transporter
MDAGWQLLVMIITCFLCILVVGLGMRFATPMELRTQIISQAVVLKDKQTWLMVMMYLAAFGSFIGFSNVFPKLIVDMFGKIPYGVGVINPNAPVSTDYAWLGAFVGSTCRPLGGWISDKYSAGRKVTGISLIFMFGFAIWGGVIIAAVRTTENPMDYWGSFLACFLRELCARGVAAPLASHVRGSVVVPRRAQSCSRPPVSAWGPRTA